MIKRKKYKKQEISPERMAILAEQGLKAVKLTKEEKQYLLNGGLKELYDIYDFAEKTIPPLESEAVNAIMNRFFCEHPKLWIRITKKIIDKVSLPEDWYMGSPAFAHRGMKAKNISFHKKVEKLIVHLEIVQNDGRLAEIHVRLTDNEGNYLSSIEAELFKGGRCIETISTLKNNTITFSSLEMDDYILRISDSKDEITSIAIKIEQ